MPDTFLYFAYGSNMFRPRLSARTPSASKVGTAFVVGRRLTFDKMSKDGSGKCDIEATGNPADEVWGVLFTIASAEKAALDSAEALGKGYCECKVQAVTSTGSVPAVTYVATAKEPGRRPYTWYKEYVVRGATEHALPAEYIARIANVAAQQDPDPRRRERHEALLSGN